MTFTWHESETIYFRNESINRTVEITKWKYSCISCAGTRFRIGAANEKASVPLKWNLANSQRERDALFLIYSEFEASFFFSLSLFALQDEWGLLKKSRALKTTLQTHMLLFWLNTVTKSHYSGQFVRPYVSVFIEEWSLINHRTINSKTMINIFLFFDYFILARESWQVHWSGGKWLEFNQKRILWILAAY